jgi:hypothetical protein
MGSIKPKEKPCRGTTAETKNFGCGVKTFHRVFGLGKMCGCYSDWLLNSEAGQIKLQKSIIKVTKPRIELEQAERQHKEKKGIAGALLVTKTIVHAYVRKRDKGKQCISCGCNWNPEFEAGHHYSANSFLTLKFNLDNIHGQCFFCNNKLEGNFQNYALNLPNRIGVERYNELVRLASIDKQFSKIWNLENLKEIRDNVKELTKILPK